MTTDQSDEHRTAQRAELGMGPEASAGQPVKALRGLTCHLVQQLSKPRATRRQSAEW